MGKSGFEVSRVPTSVALNPTFDYLEEDPYGMTPFEQPYGPPAPMGFGAQMAGNMAAPYMGQQQGGGMMGQGPQGPQGMQGMAPGMAQGQPMQNNPQAAYGPGVGAPMSPLNPGQTTPGPHSQPKSGLIARFLQERGVSPQQFAWNAAIGVGGVTDPQQMFGNFFAQQQLKQRGDIARQAQDVRSEDRQYRRQYQQQNTQDRQQWQFNKELTKLADRLGSIDAWEGFTEALGHPPETPEDLQWGTEFYAEAKGKFDRVQRRNKRLGTQLNEGWRTGKRASIAADSEFVDDDEAHEQVAMINSIIEERQGRLRQLESLKKQMLTARTGLLKKQEAGKLTDVEKAALRILQNDLLAANTMAGRARTALAKEELSDMQLWPERIAELENIDLDMMDRINQSLTQVQSLGIPIGEYAGVQGEVYTPSKSTERKRKEKAPPPTDEGFRMLGELLEEGQ